MIVYHGTTMEIQKPDIKHSKAHLDFGVGFYTTSFPKQAERWAARKGMRLSKPGIVNAGMEKMSTGTMTPSLEM